MTSTVVAFWALTGVAVLGAVAVVFARDVIRMIAGLGAFLLAGVTSLPAPGGPQRRRSGE